MATQIKLRRDTYQNWYDNNPILAEGEPGYDLTNKKLKIGDGVTLWRALPYFDDQQTDLSAYAGNIVPDSDNTRSLGSPDKQWKEIFVSTGSLYIGNVKLSNDTGQLLVQQVTDPGLVTEQPVLDAPGAIALDSLFLGGVELKASSDGKVVIPGITRASGYKVSEVYQTGIMVGIYELDQDIFIADNYSFLDITDNGNIDNLLGSLGPLTWTINGAGNLQISVNQQSDYIYNEQQMTSAMSTSLWVTEVGTAGPNGTWVPSSDAADWYQIPVSLTFRAVSIENDLGGGGGSISVGNGVGPSVENVTEILINGTVTEIEPGLVGLSVTPSIPSTKKGWINLVGDKPNNNDDAWFESVVVQGNYAYVVGGDYYVDNSEDLTKIYKFDLATGDQVWVKEIVAGRGAQFTFDIASEVITITSIANGGTGYIEGEELHFPGNYWAAGNTSVNRVTVVVDTVDEEGFILTASIKPGYDLAGILNQSIGNVQAENDNAKGFPASIAYDTNLDKLVIVSMYRSGLGDRDFDNYYTWANVFVVDPVTGVINQTLTLSTEGDIYPNSLKVKNSPGGVVVSGEKYGEFRQFGTLTIAQGYNGYFDILKSDLDPEHYPGGPYDWYGDFWVSGTGISTIENVDSVNTYPNLPTTVRVGSGAVFEISDLGDGNYYTTGTLNPGINYRGGHKIKVLGTNLGGATPANDCIITVDSVGPSGDVFGWSVSGTAAGSTFTTYSGVSGTAYQSGSGATVSASVNAQTGVVSINNFDNAGSGYVNGDVLTIAGTAFLDGTSPANDVTFALTSVGGGGAANSWNTETVTGSAPTNKLRIYVNGVDFSGVGTWSMKQNLGGEAFLWTPNWSNAIGGPSGDRFYDVCYSQDGNSIFAVGRGRYETAYDQALVVKFNASTGAVIWGKDIKFSQAATNGREARSVCLVPGNSAGSSDLIVAGAWYNGDPVYATELILTRITEAGTAVWQKSYRFNYDGNNIDIDYEMKVEAYGNNVLVSLETSTPIHSRALGYLIVNPANGVVVDSRVLSSDGNGNRNFYEVPTPNFSDIYTDGNGDSYAVMVGKTYVPTDNYYNGLLLKLPLDGYTNLSEGEFVSIGEHILGKYNWNVTSLTSAFDSFTATEHIDTIEESVNLRSYRTRTPGGFLKVFRTDIIKDSDGYLEFGDGSKQSFATDKIPQIPAANDYYLTEQDSGKHIFFENENGYVYIPHRTVKDLPVGFTFTVVNTTGSDCWVTTQNEADGSGYRARLKLAGRNIDTYTIGIPDSGSGSMVTFLKIKSGYSMLNTDYDDEYPDVWIVSGPGDIYNND